MRRTNHWILGAMITLLTLGGITSCNEDESLFEQRTQQNSSVTPSAPGDPGAVTPDGPGDPSNPDNPSADVTDFAYGADPSWITEMEAAGNKFYDKNGTETECLQLLKNTGFNAARFRVWVDPSTYPDLNGYCDKADVVEKAKRAQALGYHIMIDFHYSDGWADPKQQRKPKVWTDIETIDELAQAAADHTTDVLQALKDAGVSVAWVQIGNETMGGMMFHKWDDKEYEENHTALNCEMGTENYVKVHNKAREAAKAVFPDTKIVVHFQNGQRDHSATVQKLKDMGAEFDIFGVSLYPDFSKANWYADYIDVCISNLKKISDNCDKDVMICELGATSIASWDAKRAIWNTVIRSKSELSRCKGVFYWEPEASGWNGYPMGGFLASGKPADALDVFDGQHTELLPENDPDGGNDRNEDALYIDNTNGEELGKLEKTSEGLYQGTITFSANWENFTVTDKNGVIYGPTSWTNEYEIAVAKGEFNHFWIDGNAGTYDIWFDIKNSKWGTGKPDSAEPDPTPDPDPDPDPEPANDGKLYLYNKDNGELMATCEADANGIWKTTVTTTKDWQNFFAKDSNGKNFGVSITDGSWGAWDEFVENESSNLWFDKEIATAGTYNIWFDLANGKWGGEAANN